MFMKEAQMELIMLKSTISIIIVELYIQVVSNVMNHLAEFKFESLIGNLAKPLLFL
jgi:hypothetical protein